MKRELYLRVRGESDTPMPSFTEGLLAVACFPLLMAVSSFFGALLPAMVVADQHVAHPNWRIIWTPLANGVAAGACLGIVCGVLCTIAYKFFHPLCEAYACANRAFDLSRGPLFWIGLATGTLIGVLTISTFGSKLISDWPIF